MSSQPALGQQPAPETDRLDPRTSERTTNVVIDSAQRVTASTRFVASIPAVGFFIASIVLAVGTLVKTVETSIEFIDGHFEIFDLAIELVEYADLFLLAVVLYILALGLVSLFISDSLPLPRWLEFHDFDDLKERLVSVIGAMLGVYFLGYVLKGATGLDVLWMGLAVAIVVMALSFFVRSVLMGGGHKQPDNAKPGNASER